jgi:hypothetical protein
METTKASDRESQLDTKEVLVGNDKGGILAKQPPQDGQVQEC